MRLIRIVVNGGTKMIHKLVGIEYVIRDGELISEREVWEEDPIDTLCK